MWGLCEESQICGFQLKGRIIPLDRISRKGLKWQMNFVIKIQFLKGGWKSKNGGQLVVMKA